MSTRSSPHPRFYHLDVHIFNKCWYSEVLNGFYEIVAWQLSLYHSIYMLYVLTYKSRLFMFPVYDIFFNIIIFKSFGSKLPWRSITSLLHQSSKRKPDTIWKTEIIHPLLNTHWFHGVWIVNGSWNTATMSVGLYDFLVCDIGRQNNTLKLCSDLGMHRMYS